MVFYYYLTRLTISFVSPPRYHKDKFTQESQLGPYPCHSLFCLSGQQHKIILTAQYMPPSCECNQILIVFQTVVSNSLLMAFCKYFCKCSKRFQWDHPETQLHNQPEELFKAQIYYMPLRWGL
jgi:hypothetical protein